MHNDNPQLIFLCAGGLLLLVATFCVMAALRGEDRLVAIMDTPTSSALDILAIASQQRRVLGRRAK